MCLSLERAVEVSGEGVQSGAAISHLKHILPTGIHHDIIMTSTPLPSDGPLLFQRADNQTLGTPTLETEHFHKRAHTHTLTHSFLKTFVTTKKYTQAVRR